MHKIFRFGLPLGSAVIVTALLQCFASFRLTVHTVDALFPTKSLVTEDYITITCSFVALILTMVLWKSVIFQGSSQLGIFWFIAAILNCTIQMLQSCYDLSYHRKFGSQREFYSTIWSLIVTIIINVYVYIVAAQMVGCFLLRDELNSYRDTLKPIGSKCVGIVEFYQGNPKLGSRVLLVTDALWSAFLLLAYELPHYDFTRFDWLNDFGKADIYFFSGKAASIISFEEVYMRIFRVFNGLVGCSLIGRRVANLKPWLFCQLMGVAASIIMYIILFAMTKDWASEVSGYIYQFLFTSDLVFRFGVLHFCIEYKRDYEMISIV